MKKLVLIAFLTLTACSDLMQATYQPSKPNAKNVQAAKDHLTYQLIDPSSAQFRDIRGATATLADGTKRDLVCLELNGKNRLGGYVGFSPFSVGFKNGTIDPNQVATVYYCPR
ncbi:hypothetical protein [Fuscibacter oryzae]|uniref:DUF4156 domain-containing protein n=1 Tax=Fuscibacter oryzae TaxID=2803939 RepID=A0A8J7MPT0_9RHOB|nr:hypothetical protein [Fuscibacter oryzae]MBL4927776.1 hypothetical protein [Fuscibacter oryzae]